MYRKKKKYSNLFFLGRKALILSKFQRYFSFLFFRSDLKYRRH